MKLKAKTPVLLMFALIIALIGITCVNQDIEVLGTEANLISLSLESALSADGVPTIITDTVSKVAVPIPSGTWNKEDLSADELYGLDYDQTGTTIGWVDIRVRNKETGKISGRLRPNVSKGARAQWGIGTRSTKPDAFYDTRVPATLDGDEYIYIEVTSEDAETVNYFRFYAKLLSWTTNLQYIRVDRKLADGSTDLVNPPREGKAGASVDGHSTGGGAWNAPTIQECSLALAQKEGQGALVTAVPFDPNATASYAVVTGDGAPGPFTPSDVPINIGDQDFLYVEVTAENTLDKEYFKFKVSVGRLANIASLKFNGKDGKDVDVYGLGLPQTDWAKVGAGEYQTADQPTAGFGIKLVMDDPDAKFEWAKIANENAARPAFNDPKPSPGSGTAILRFNNSSTNVPEVLAIKVTSANDIVIMYYKVRVMNLAANILKHPKSTWYYRPDIAGAGVSAEGKKPVAALTIELDPPDTGQYTYQWYEADSWYGLYGRNGTSRDEKNNITTVNGGPGQYFYLVQPDEPPITLTPDGYGAEDWAKSPGAWNNWPDSPGYHWADYTRGGQPMAWTLEGETGKSYTPRIDWIDNTDDMEENNEFFTNTQNNSFPIPPIPPRVNFLSGATNESRYYWVKVTDKTNGLTVTSERALILTETEPKMEHFIFDLATLPKKNIIPFTKEGTDYSNIYKIDVKDYPFPDDFNDKAANYASCIAHAQYFLPDGRAWTQNWTHGNFHMGMDDGSLIWYQNNMGANGGAIPVQTPHSQAGGLTQKPDWIGFTPSGDPTKGLPPPINAAGDLPKGIYSMNATEKYPAGVAQGYFAAFIDLLEVRFQTAPPK